MWSGRTGTVHLEGCATITDSGSTFEYDGSYTLHAPGGGSLAGEFSGTTYPTLSLRLDVTTTEGGLFRDVTGQLLIEGDWSNTPSGTLTGHLVRPGPH